MFFKQNSFNADTGLRVITLDPEAVRVVSPRRSFWIHFHQIKMEAIGELEDLYEGAEETIGPTAQRLGGFHKDRVYKIGRLVITSVSLCDDGLKGGTKDTAILGAQAEYVQDPETTAAMEGLGLPISFRNDNREDKVIARANRVHGSGMVTSHGSAHPCAFATLATH